MLVFFVAKDTAFIPKACVVMAAAPPTLLNLTPHAVTVFADGGELVWPRSGGVARLVESRKSAPEDVVLGVEDDTGRGGTVTVVAPPKFIAVEGIPEGRRTGLIVSSFVGSYLRETSEDAYLHVYSPDTGPGSVVRDESGAILGAKRLIRWC
jgi:hypothetical protein